MTAPASAARARTAPVAALAVLALLLLPAAIGGGGSVRAMGALPACRYGDVLTTPRAYGDWSITLVDTILRVPKGYVPPDLVPVTRAGLAGKDRMIRAVAIDDLEAMAEAALAAGAPIGVESAYRDDAAQRSLYEDWERSGAATSLEAPARPGHSEHQLGLAIDFRSDAPDAQPGQERFATTPGGRWMAAHAWEYGWLMSYPDDAEGRTCYAHEPWHFRYVGRALAARIHLSALTVREYLWSQFTTSCAPGEHVRVQALLDWSERDIWMYIEREGIPIPKMYFARSGSDGKRYRFRSLGCWPISKPVESDAETIAKIIDELAVTKTSERAGRAQDHHERNAMQKLRAKGFM